MGRLSGLISQHPNGCLVVKTNDDQTCNLVDYAGKQV